MVATFTISGMVSGANGAVVLQNNAGDDLTVTSNGSFTFSSAINSGTTYAATILTQPATQTCTVTNGSGTASANVTNIAVNCVTNTYTIGGTVSGLSGTVVLQNNAGDNLTLNANGSFTFSSAINSGTTYAATVLTQPATQICTVTNGSGTANANVTNIAVNCVTNTYTIGGTVSGLSGTVVLQNNAGNNLTVTSNGGFTFSSHINSGTTYAATILTQPATQTCTVANGSGTASANVTNIAVNCVTNTYTISGTVSGLSGTVVLQNNAGNNLTVSANGSFTFSSAINSGTTYAATVLTQPATQTCTVTNGSGTASANVTNIAVNCVTNTYTISGTVSGLISGGSVVLENNAGDNLTVSANGSFTFNSAINSGTTYAATVLTQPAFQTCTVTNGSGTASANVTNVTVSCSTTTSAATLSLTIQQTKTFHFSWTAVSGATSYKLTEDPTGSAGYTQVGSNLSSSTTTYDEIVPLYLRVNARYIVSACVGGACINSNSVSVSGSLAAAVGYFKASNTTAGDQFGFSVALSADGSTMAIGADMETSNATGIGGNQSDTSNANAGAVYVFKLTGTTWSQQAYVKASNTATDQYFGYSVALSGDGNTLAVGAYAESSNATGIGGDQSDTSATGAGAVYVFTRSGSTWSQQAYVKASNTHAYYYFGTSVVLSTDGNTLAVGSYGEASTATGINGDDSYGGVGGAGAVYMFTRSGTTWSQQTYIKASNTEANDQFGWSVALSGDGATLAVGAKQEASDAIGINGDDTNNTDANAGAVYVFKYSGSAWSQQAYVKASNTDAAGDYFGASVALSADGSTLAVGAYGEDGNNVGINGDQATDISYTFAGAVYVFTRLGSTWSQQAYVKASNTATLGGFGYSIALAADGNTLAVGSYGEASNATGINGDQTYTSAGNAGAVYMFTRSGSIWSQQAYVKASNTDGTDEFGVSVALSADGNTLGAAAMFEASNATGVNGDQTNNTAAGAGAVYLY